MNKSEENRAKKRTGFNFRRMQIIVLMFVLLTFALFMVQRGISYKRRVAGVKFLEESELLAAEHLELEPQCLLVWQDDALGIAGRELMEDVLSQMKVPYDTVKAEDVAPGGFSGYSSAVLSVADLGTMGNEITDMMNWLEEGGNLMLAVLPSKSGYLDMIAGDLGIIGMAETYSTVTELKFPRPFMIGDSIFPVKITDPYESSADLLLDESCEIYAESADENKIPLVWRRSVGKGSAAVSNLGFMDKIYRGFYGAVYSLLGDGFAWPVINGSTFYIDDFPSPVPQGEGKYITRDYNMTVRDFMTQVWWPDIIELGEKYGIHYTGLVIEQYSDDTKAPLPKNEDVSRFRYFGKSLLDMGGEIGFHGYNHMPLVLDNFDYYGEYDEYTPWASESDMQASITELDSFCKSLFPGEKFQVYVPPSNILSAEGRKMLKEKFPQIKVIASTYLPGTAAYSQEFEVAEDGMVETPRVISGYIMSDFEYLSAMSELTFRYVNTHFQHPDDVLDEDRGASLGWAEMYDRLSRYVGCLYEAAPNIRNLTGIELAAAVQRYDNLEVSQTYEENSVSIKLGGFIDEAYLLVRLNGRQPAEAEGGRLEKLQDGLWLLEASQPDVKITLE